MSLWGSKDQANNAPLQAAAQVRKTPSAANRDILYNANTPKIVGIDPSEVTHNEVTHNDGITHAGWVLKIVGTGGRAGRVAYEVLVAGGSIDSFITLPHITLNGAQNFITVNGGNNRVTIKV